MTDDNQPDERQPDDAEPDADGRVDPEVPNDSKTASEGGKVLTPEELGITDSEYVEPLDDDGRYVVSPGGSPPNVARSPAEEESPSSVSDDPSTGPADDTGVSDRRESPGGPSPAGPRDPRQGGAPASPEAARSLLADELALTDASYGIDIVARFDGETVRHRTVSNDVVGTFENLVQWYARHITDDTPVDQVIEILLNEANFGGGSEPNLADLLDAHDLDSSDSIADLVEAIRAETDR